MKKTLSASFMFLYVLPLSFETTRSNGPGGYLIGGIIAVFLLGYLIFTLIKPEKF